MREQIAPLDDEKPRKFGGAQPRAGRPLGALNKVTASLKQAILDGAVTCDYALDPNDKDARPICVLLQIAIQKFSSKQSLS
jgi:hypothetical protein